MFRPRLFEHQFVLRMFPRCESGLDSSLRSCKACDLFAMDVVDAG